VAAVRRLHVNVISGQNGSGKSAVMQALQCCFGATARSTGRAAALHSFVKTGAPEALVQVPSRGLARGAAARL
jgi:structural maintenance of chromosomes protein 6